MSSQSSSNQNKRPNLYVGTACDQCFRRKARCAGEKPSCSRCKIGQSPCTYSIGNRKGRRSTKSDPTASTATSYDSSAESATASTQDVSQRCSPERRSSVPDAFVSNCNQATYDPVSQPSIGTTAETTSHIQPSTKIDDFLAAYAAAQPASLASPSTLFQPPRSPWVTSSPCYGPNTSSVINGHLWSPSSLPHIEASEIFTPTEAPLLLHVLCGNSAVLQKCLARLHAYNTGTSQDSPQETLSCLQETLAIIAECISYINVPDLNARPNAVLIAESLPPPSTPQLTPAVAILCIHIIHLITTCYVKLREGASRLPHDCKDLLDAYIIQDMQRCQSVAMKLDLWCRSLAYVSQDAQSPQQYEVGALLGIMTESVTALLPDHTRIGVNL